MRELQAVRAFVDRVEKGVATLLLGEDESVTMHVPVAWLPPRAGEGAVLRARFELDKQAMRAAKARVQGLPDQLGDEP
jgi:hypothetical protein